MSDIVEVAGWLADLEGAFLAGLAAGRDVLEIGSFKGKSTIWMARTANSVQCVDTFTSTNVPNSSGDTLTEFLNNLASYKVSNKVRVHIGTSARILSGISMQRGCFDLAFIDASHDEASVYQDLTLCLPLLRQGGLLAFHDYQSPTDPGVFLAVQRFLDEGGTLLGTVGTVAVCKPGK